MDVWFRCEAEPRNSTTVRVPTTRGRPPSEGWGVTPKSKPAHLLNAAWVPASVRAKIVQGLQISSDAEAVRPQRTRYFFL